MQAAAVMAASFTRTPVKLTPEINSSTGRLNLRRKADLSLNPNRLSYLLSPWIQLLRGGACTQPTANKVRQERREVKRIRVFLSAIVLPARRNLPKN
jgi:hypothetical protein